MKNLKCLVIFVFLLVFVGCGSVQEVETTALNVVAVDMTTGADGDLLIVDGEKIENAEIGEKEENLNSTDKKSYFVTYDDGGFVLDNCYGDPSYIRNYVGSNVLNESGVATPKCSYARLSVNGNDKGIYVMSEAVDEKFVNENFSDKSGNLYKMGKGCTLRYNEVADYSDFELILGDDESFENISDFTKQISELSEKKDSLKEDDNDGKAEIEKNIGELLDIEAFLKYTAFNYVFCNYDSLSGSGNNYYLYETNGKFTVIPYDMTLSLGAQNDESRASLLSPVSGNIKNYPIVDLLFAFDDYKQQYCDYVNEYCNLLSDRLDNDIKNVNSAISLALRSSDCSFYTYDEYRTAVGLLSNVEEESDSTTETYTEESTSSPKTETTLETTTIVESASQPIATSGKKAMIGDSYTSTQAIGLVVTSPADSKDGFSAYVVEATTQATTQAVTQQTTQSQSEKVKCESNIDDVISMYGVSVPDFVRERVNNIREELKNNA